MSSTIRNYALIVETDPGALVANVTKACGEGFQPLGGVTMAREPKTPAAPLGCTRYAQAMVRLWKPEELGAFNLNGR